MSPGLTLAQLSEYFHLPEKQVAAQMGMCLTSLKKVCRAHGITRWPFRKLKSLERTMQKTKEDPSAPSPMPKVEQSSISVMCTEHLQSGKEPSGKEPLGKEPLGKEPRVKQEAPSSDVTPQLSPHPPTGPLDQLHWKLHEEASDSAQTHRNLPQVDETWPTCAVDAKDANLLIVTNWSTLWTVYKLRQHLLKALGGSEIQFSEDGSQAFLWYTTYLAAMQARTVCEKACVQLRESQQQQAQHDTQHDAPARHADSVSAPVSAHHVGLPHDDEHHEHLFAALESSDLDSLVESTPGRALIESSMRKASSQALETNKAWDHPLPQTCSAPASNGGFPTQPGSSG
eukprot:CAMPEP_0177693618 /NCGR_PEP_ID=MMETSP0484_2-20121128/2494_1 /TAXON_ID=354590 /ORGANISM="Rhodomonas lens, Strain RHODO" /LENGTH=341 /DNA_ID=CAMNT_0019204437 /DNA_START=8 /DNA_END=1029 /DNA_ORIENTATION=-